ncbi:thiolase family protein [Castellaniella sp.]|uniref:thiolase family protein n=1 Tax=Castellaniella sp. TaxID=1955812 RepID=UPI003562D019
MRDVYIVGVSSTVFGKRPDTSFQELTKEAYLDVLADCGFANDGSLIEQAWFGNCGLSYWGQGGIRGQVCFTPLVEEGLFPEHVPIINVEGACATASMAFHGAWKDVLSGQTEVSLAIGVEKLVSPDDPGRVQKIFYAAIDQLEPQRWQDYYAQAGEVVGKAFETGPDRTVFMDTYAMQAIWHMKTHGTTQRQIAMAASKNHYHGSLNPKAQYRFEVSVEDVLADRVISYPLTRSMCSPLGDGAAAAILCSADALQNFPASVRDRAVKIRTSVFSGGKYRKLDEPGLSMHAAQKAYKATGLAPTDIDLVELHDATSYSELYQLEMLGFCEPGQSGALVESGATRLGGSLPVNVSGGLISKGHPIGATGLSMVYEVTKQLRGEAEAAQVKGASLGLIENGGGVMGFDEAVCAITILEKSS